MLQWAGKKFKEIHYVHKGMNCLTEMYSAIAADVPIESDPTTQKDPKLVKKLLSADRVSVSVSASYCRGHGASSSAHTCILYTTLLHSHPQLTEFCY